MGTSGRFQIKHLSKSGELLSCINCFAGQVTVFRAYTDEELLPYQRALSGRPAGERFAFALDGSDFDINKANAIGFGEKFLGEETLHQYLMAAGIPETLINSILLSYGLSEYKDTLCSSLSECAARRMQLLGASYSKSQVLILNTPFEPLATQWRERFAQLIITDAMAKERITVVSRLSYRPQCWIGNELVIRMQVGENIQKTIGFGAGASTASGVIDQVRDLLKDEAAVQQILSSQSFSRSELKSQSTGSDIYEKIDKSAPPAGDLLGTNVAASGSGSGSDNTPSRMLHRAVFILLLGAVLAGSVATYVLLMRPEIKTASTAGRGREGAERHPAGEINNGGTELAPANPAPSQPVRVSSPFPVDKSALNPKPVEAVKKTLHPSRQYVKVSRRGMLLDRYPSEVKKAILNAFRGGDGGKSSPLPVGEKGLSSSGTAIKRRPVDLFDSLRKLGASGISVTPGAYRLPVRKQVNRPNPSSQSKEDLERHERIRQKFLEAINRAMEKKEAEQNSAR